MKKYLFKIALGGGALIVLMISYEAILLPSSSSSSLSKVKTLTSSVISRVSSIKIPSIDNPLDSSLLGEKNETVYKWKDSKGKLHYSNEPPKAVKNFSTFELSSQQNVMQSKGADPEQEKAKLTTDSSEKTGLSGILESYSKPLEKAKAAREKMEQRNRQLEKITQ